MLNFDQAIALTLAQATPLGAERVRIEQATGRITAAPVRADAAFPRQRTSSMDGYAVRRAEAAGGARLRVAGVSYPGKPFTGQVGTGECIRIFTGAAVPDGVDQVVIQEVVSRDGDMVGMPDDLSASRFVRPAGSDFGAGDVLVEADLALTPQRLVAAAAADLAELHVWRRPRVAILATGDELAAPGEARNQANTIPESVSLGVMAMAGAWGAQTDRPMRLPDDLATLQAAAGVAVQSADLVVVTGGASVGEKDFARQMFDGLSLELVFSKAAIKPGKPVWLGRAAGRLVLGLPGNPTSAMVTARLFLAPLVVGLGGSDHRAATAWREEILAGSLPATDDRETFVRARRTPAGLLALSDQGSGAQRALALADVLIRRAAGAPAAAMGEQVMAMDF